MYLVTCLAVVAVAVARHTEVDTAPRTVALTCIVIMVLSWAVGRRTAPVDDDHDHETAGGRWYVVFLIVLFVVAVAADDMSTFTLFALCPMVFLCLSQRPALLAVAVLNLAPLPINLLRGVDLAAMRTGAAISVLGLTFSMLIGTTIDRVTRQNAERGQLIQDLEATRAEVSALSHEAGVAAERARLAADIHDTLAQGFTSIVTLLQAAESELDTDRAAADRHLALAVRTARDNLAEARAMVTVLTPAELRTAKLAEVVARQVARLADDTGAATSCTVENLPPALPTAVEVVLVRALQESLANIRKHAGASTVTVDLIGAADTVTLTVSDDGAGFDPATAADGYGLRGMLARAEQVAGKLAVHSAPGLGTTLTLELPA
ncbi:sensor histidine kinase [Catellatospora chokoriensis]|uniref:Two-component sensor histidine kinase n=1 Tax=Catellatospora chokoriensis TaxID=310353 RepID=A0A8J3NSQ8_9ACTN|nr:sensor histidine kinase [Catellatospora chokoriensis]GIF89510.1 two-component sensor histidine kinase [Catellatospora chokoriensis]